MKKQLFLLFALPMLWGLVGCAEEEISPYPEPNQETQYTTIGTFSLRSSYELFLEFADEKDALQVYADDNYLYPGFELIYFRRHELDMNLPFFMWVETLDGKEIGLTYSINPYTPEYDYLLFDPKLVEEGASYDRITSLRLAVRNEQERYHAVLKFYQPSTGLYFKSLDFTLDMRGFKAGYEPITDELYHQHHLYFIEYYIY